MGYWSGYPNQALVDTFLSWYGRPGDGPPGWDKIFSEGRLHIYRRAKKP
jgi:hypothetical protein